jgi:hypothetical protein
LLETLYSYSYTLIHWFDSQVAVWAENRMTGVVPWKLWVAYFSESEMTWAENHLMNRNRVLIFVKLHQRARYYLRTRTCKLLKLIEKKSQTNFIFCILSYSHKHSMIHCIHYF